jgi:hypothetical protein
MATMVASSARGFTSPYCESRAGRELAEIAWSRVQGSQNLQPHAARYVAGNTTRAAGVYLKANADGATSEVLETQEER